MPDLPGLIVGGGSLIVLVLMFVYCEDFGNGNIERMDPPVPRPKKDKNESLSAFLAEIQPAE